VSKPRTFLAVAMILIGGSAMAQIPDSTKVVDTPSTAAAVSTESTTPDPASPPAANSSGKVANNPCPTPKIQHLRPTSQCGLNMFEPPKEESPEVPFDGLKVDWGAAFSQTYQGLKHQNSALPNIVSGVDQNQLMKIGPGFGYATANLYLNAQIADGIRLALTMYLSSRHHEETWVKDGYILIDKSPIRISPYHGIANALWEKFITVKVGHFEINYGDAHFRRTDNGMGMYNPFIGNYLLDAFTTEIGGEVYIRANGFLAMGSITGGEIHGDVIGPGATRRPAFISKIGFDRQLTPKLRVRLTGSNYTIRKSPSDTLYSGDRAGSPYFFVMENTQATVTGNAFSGTINPGFSYKLTAFQVNPFIKYGGLELFGVIEHADGNAKSESAARTWNQYAGDIVYRFADNHLYVGARYNYAKGRLAGKAQDVSANRNQYGVGWFINRYLLIKAEYVIQNYKDFPAIDIRNGGRFQGPVIDAVLGF
jgi:hypothetical protein